MRKLFPIILAFLVIQSCQKKSSDIDVSKLSTPCECIDALVIVYSEINDVLDGDKMSEIDDKRFQQIEKIAEKGTEIENHLKEKGMNNVFVLSQCSNYQKYTDLHFKAFQ